MNLSNDFDENPNAERFKRWSERRQEHLGFLNNLLIGLGAGLIGFAMGHLPGFGGSPATHWEHVVFGIALIVVTLSVALGLCLAANRLRAIRMTASRIRVDSLWRKWRKENLRQESGTGKDKILPENIEPHYQRWKRWSRLHMTENSRKLFESCSACLSVSKLEDLESLRDAAMKAAGDWEDGLDDWTYRLLWSEFLTFGIGALLFAIMTICQSLKF